MTRRLLIVLILFVFACGKRDFNIQNLNGNKISVFGHGGMGWGQGYPINTFESIQKCLNHDVDGVEIDVQMTKDNVLVAFHDRNLVDDTFFSGNIFNMLWDEIKDLNLSNSPYPQYKIASLDELLTNLNNAQSRTIIFDCKNFSLDYSAEYINNYTNAFINIITKFGLEDDVILELKKETLIEAFQNKNPNLTIYGSGSFEYILPIAIEYNLPGITLNNEEVEPYQIDLAHDNGIMVAVFNAIDRESNIDAIDKNVDFIISDRVKFLLETLD